MKFVFGVRPDRADILETHGPVQVESIESFLSVESHAGATRISE